MVESREHAHPSCPSACPFLLNNNVHYTIYNDVRHRAHLHHLTNTNKTTTTTTTTTTTITTVAFGCVLLFSSYARLQPKKEA